MTTYQKLLEKALDLLEIGVYIYTPLGKESSPYLCVKFL